MDPDLHGFRLNAARYILLPFLLVTTVIVVLAAGAARTWIRRAALVWLAALLAVNYSVTSDRPRGPRWDRELARARRACSSTDRRSAKVLVAPSPIRRSTARGERSPRTSRRASTGRGRRRPCRGSASAGTPRGGRRDSARSCLATQTTFPAVWRSECRRTLRSACTESWRTRLAAETARQGLSRSSCLLKRTPGVRAPAHDPTAGRGSDRS